MIFATVGTQLPFDRLVRTVDRWAGDSRSAVFAQTGNGHYQPQHMDWQRQLGPDEFQSQLNRATAVVAHAGIGTILSALELGKPVLVLPRRAELGEHRNDHQWATARRFGEMELVKVAADEDELISRLNELTCSTSGQRLEAVASPALIEYLQSFLAATRCA